MNRLSSTRITSSLFKPTIQMRLKKIISLSLPLSLNIATVFSHFFGCQQEALYHSHYVYSFSLLLFGEALCRIFFYVCTIHSLHSCFTSEQIKSFIGRFIEPFPSLMMSICIEADITKQISFVSTNIMSQHLLSIFRHFIFMFPFDFEQFLLITSNPTTALSLSLCDTEKRHGKLKRTGSEEKQNILQIRETIEWFP